MAGKEGINWEGTAAGPEQIWRHNLASPQKQEGREIR